MSKAFRLYGGDRVGKRVEGKVEKISILQKFVNQPCNVTEVQIVLHFFIDTIYFVNQLICFSCYLSRTPWHLACRNFSNSQPELLSSEI